MSTKTNYIGYKLIMNIKKGDLLGYFSCSKISDLAYFIETLVFHIPVFINTIYIYAFWQIKITKWLGEIKRRGLTLFFYKVFF